MTVPGNDCPECSARLSADGCPKCGWGRGPRPSACDCGERYRSSGGFVAGEDGRQRCASCHVGYLKTRAAPGDDPDVARCRAELQRLLGWAPVAR